tara:strand:- start:31 stop:471 length:441 start_codon:yes stop_codon:yes gene_type:complete
MSNGRGYFKYAAGLGQVGQYQLSAIPFATASFLVPGGGHADAPLQLEFGGVTRFFTVINTHKGQNAPLRVGFSSQGVTGSGGDTGLGTKYFILDNGESYTAELRVTSIFLMGDLDATNSSASVIAGITGISQTHLTGNWSGSLGVG